MSTTTTSSTSYPIVSYRYQQDAPGVLRPSVPREEWKLYPTTTPSGLRLLLETTKEEDRDVNIILRIVNGERNSLAGATVLEEFDFVHYSGLPTTAKSAPIKAVQGGKQVGFRFLYPLNVDSSMQCYKRFQLTFRNEQDATKFVSSIRHVCPCTISDAPRGQQPPARATQRAPVTSIGRNPPTPMTKNRPVVGVGEVSASQPTRVVESSWVLPVEQSQSQGAYTPGEDLRRDTQLGSGERVQVVGLHGRNTPQERPSTPGYSQQFAMPALPSSLIEPARRATAAFPPNRTESGLGTTPFVPSSMLGRTETRNPFHAPAATSFAFNSSQMSSASPASQPHSRPLLPRSVTLPVASPGMAPTSILSSSGEKTPGGGSFMAPGHPMVVSGGTPQVPSLPSTGTHLPPSSEPSSSSSQRLTQSAIVSDGDILHHTTRGQPLPQPTMGPDTPMIDRTETCLNLNDLSTLELEKMVADVINEPGFAELMGKLDEMWATRGLIGTTSLRY
ncbi:hypothetical protein CPB86DRAFT_591995 [Serendipita vermifera]|nr:hypothetical protein CPB86DRAFT_591995 [Serendipita vermifera]